MNNQELLDQFAMCAMSALIRPFLGADGYVESYSTITSDQMKRKAIASQAYLYARAMLEEREASIECLKEQESENNLNP
jgi:hypothetical protein